MADPVIIVDENGIEHEFPAGFDPIRASQIVRKQAAAPDQSAIGKFVDWAVSPTAPGIAAQTAAGKLANSIDTTDRTPVHSSITDVLKDAPGIAKDLASGLWNHPIETLRGGAAGLTQGVGDALAANSSPAALAALASGPAGKLAKGVPALSKLVRLGSLGANATFAAKGAEDVVNAPDLEGKLMGAAQMAMGAHGVGADPAVMTGVRNSATKAGEVLTKAADRPGFVRATAIGTLGGAAATGHPTAAAMGLPLLLAPEAMRATGQALTRFGTGSSKVVPLAGSIGRAEPRARTEPTRVPYDQPIGETAQEASRRMTETAKTDLADQLRAYPAHEPVDTTRFLEDLKKLDPADAKAIMDARTAARAESRATAAPPDLPTSGPMEEALAGGPATPAEAPYSFYDSLPAKETMSMDDILKGPGTMTPEPSRAPSGRGPDPRIEQGVGPDRGPTREQFGAADTARKAGFDDIQSQMLRAIMEQEGAGEYPGMTAEGSGQLDPITGASVGPTVQTPSDLLRTPVTRITEPGVSLASNKPETWFARGHGNPEALNEIYKSGRGQVNQGILEGPISFGATDELGNPIGTIPSAEVSARYKSSLGTDLPPDAEITGTANYDPSNPPPGPSIAMTEPTVVPDTDPRVAAPVPETALPPTLKPRVRVSPIGSLVEPSRSRRGKSSMSATPGYTNADITAAGLDPSVAHTHLTPEQAQRMIAARKARQDKYYAAALSDKAVREAGLSDAGAL